jgi:SAM-dependent methyltransferase
MMKKSNPVFNTSKKDLEKVWIDLQRFQVDFAFHQELALYYQSPRWMSSERVLDAGCGNGYYAKMLSRFFPNKKFVGVDLSNELIDMAYQDNPQENFGFFVGDFFDSEGIFDAIIMRLFLQHLQNPLETLNKAKTLLQPGGCLLVIDSIDNYRYYYPDVPKFRTLFNLYRNQQHHGKRNRDVATRMADFVKDNSAWKVQLDQDIVIPSTLQGNQELFLKIYSLFIDMVQAVGEIDYSFQEVRDELTTWSEQGGYTQIGLKLLSLVRV